MKPKILVWDTSILCVYLQIPGKDTCDGELAWTHDRLHAKIEADRREGWKFVLPLASVIETGNHIAQCS